MHTEIAVRARNCHASLAPNPETTRQDMQRALRMAYAGFFSLPISLL